jgi:hypothetical protein
MRKAQQANPQGKKTRPPYDTAKGVNQARFHSLANANRRAQDGRASKRGLAKSKREPGGCRRSWRMMPNCRARKHPRLAQNARRAALSIVLQQVSVGIVAAWPCSSGFGCEPAPLAIGRHFQFALATRIGFSSPRYEMT